MGSLSWKGSSHQIKSGETWSFAILATHFKVEISNNGFSFCILICGMCHSPPPKKKTPFQVAWINCLENNYNKGVMKRYCRKRHVLFVFITPPPNHHLLFRFWHKNRHLQCLFSCKLGTLKKISVKNGILFSWTHYLFFCHVTFFFFFFWLMIYLKMPFVSLSWCVESVRV